MVQDVDTMARMKAAELIRERFLEIVEQMKRGEKPVLIMPKRTLSNTIYDAKRKLLLLGPEKLKRSFLDTGEAKRFMQTVLMASIIYEALVNNEYPTIRDLYYRGKHTIRGKENTWDEQRESDAAIRDIEAYTGLLREEMLILSKEKGKVVGKMRIRSGGDVIDLSRMGHGAYSIEPTPDQIEFLDVDAEYVLVIEKDAVFQQLHRIRFWDQHKALLVTSAGQPDRATRRFVRRLNEELGLPVYILTDSIPADEVVVLRNPLSGEVKIGPVEELVGEHFSGLERERVTVPLEVLSWSPVTGKITWSPVSYIYRHRIREPILRIETRGRGVVRVTKAHSLFVFRGGEIKILPAKEIRPGDYIIVAERLPALINSEDPAIIVAELLRRAAPRYSKRFNLYNTVNLFIDGQRVRLGEASDEEVFRAKALKLSRSKWVIPNKIDLDEDLAWLMGIYTAEGSRYGLRYLVFNLNIKERGKVKRIARILREKFGIEPEINTNEAKSQVKVVVSSRVLYLVFEELGLLGTAKDKRVPSIIVSSPRNIVLAYLKGLIDGDGSIDEYGDIVYSTRSSVLARQVFLLLQFLGVNPTLVQNKDDYIIRISKNTSRTPPEVYRYITGKEPELRCELPSEPIYGLPISNELKKELIKLMNRGLASYSSKNKTISKAKLSNLLNKGLILGFEGYRVLANGDAVVVEVNAVDEEMYEGYVYDFAVPGDNSFIGGYGIVYHNSDPYGWYIYSVFKIGSVTLSYESERLATPQARFIGVMPSDIFGDEVLEKYANNFAKLLGKRGLKKVLTGKKPLLDPRERRNYIIRAKPKDVLRAIELVGIEVFKPFKNHVLSKLRISGKERDQITRKRHAGYDWFKTPEWIREVGIFFATLSKLEIEALTSKGLRFLAFKYIPEKIETGDWIE